jgi:hypothetical protein
MHANSLVCMSMGPEGADPRLAIGDRNLARRVGAVPDSPVNLVEVLTAALFGTSLQVTAAQSDQICVCHPPLGCTGSAAPNGG